MRTSIHPFYSTDAWIQTRNRVRERDRFVCQYCHRKGFQADHIMPRHLCENPLDPNNLVCCCADCNKVAGGSPFQSFAWKKAYILFTRGLADYPIPPDVVRKAAKHDADDKKRAATKKPKRYTHAQKMRDWAVEQKRRRDGVH